MITLIVASLLVAFAGLAISALSPIGRFRDGSFAVSAGALGIIVVLTVFEAGPALL